MSNECFLEIALRVLVFQIQELKYEWVSDLFLCRERILRTESGNGGAPCNCPDAVWAMPPDLESPAFGTLAKWNLFATRPTALPRSTLRIRTKEAFHFRSAPIFNDNF